MSHRFTDSAAVLIAGAAARGWVAANAADPATQPTLP